MKKTNNDQHGQTYRVFAKAIQHIDGNNFDELEI